MSMGNSNLVFPEPEPTPPSIHDAAASALYTKEYSLGTHNVIVQYTSVYAILLNQTWQV